MVETILLSILASTISLLLGGLFVLIIHKYQTKIGDSLLSFSAGTLLGLLSFDLFPELYEIGYDIDSLGFLYAIFIFIGFLVILFLLHYLIEKFFHEKEEHHEHSHIESYLQTKNTSLKFAAISLVVALFFHNFPEGMSLGATLKRNLNDGISLAIFLAIHNFAMGLAMMLTLKKSNMNQLKAWGLLILSSIPFILGSILGYISLVDIPWVNLILLSLTSAILCFVIVEEAFPIFKKKKCYIELISLILGFSLAILFHFVF